MDTAGFSAWGELAGPFSDDPRITDPRGMNLSPAGDLVYITSGDDRVLALDKNGNVTLDSGRKQGLDAGGGTFAPDGRYCVTLRRRGTILALPPRFDTEGEPLLSEGAVPFLEDSASAMAASCTCPRESAPPGRLTTPSRCSTTTGRLAIRGSSATPS